MTKHHSLSPNGTDDETRNASGNLVFEGILGLRLSRRNVFKGGFALAASRFFGAGLLAPMGNPATAAPLTTTQAFTLGFPAVAKHTGDLLTVPGGYRATLLYRAGDPIDNDTPDYANDGSDTAASFNFRAGDNHDGMHYFGLNGTGTAPDRADSNRGLLCVNHEYINQSFLHTAAEVGAGLSARGRLASAQIDKEVNAHGVSIVEVVREGGSFRVNRASPFNRRITAATPIALHGPARGDGLMVTRFSPDGTRTRGTLNNCANGYTPWGTYLTCEENWAGYFKRTESAALGAKAAAQNRYMGAKASNGNYGWANPPLDRVDETGLYHRGDLTPGAGVGEDYRNAANTLGWVVEIGPLPPRFGAAQAHRPGPLRP
ncbi:MAG: DUF839 domain-containing protein [Gammaproteobacteria bacterium]|nr:DUF839 domain-containing protein [Gammaproteobacteria bacterium]MBU1656426.1 DUF839 domain-containing protein [Gammaproteobacteria bacterium]MBU1960114.1 DUF839 domain-containing protein [Gammaproteobacteria bacterium]